MKNKKFTAIILVLMAILAVLWARGDLLSEHRAFSHSQELADFLDKNNLVRVDDFSGVIVSDPVPYFMEPKLGLPMSDPEQVNTFGVRLYGYSFFYLHKDALKHLQIAAKLAQERGYSLKLLDGFRPFAVQSYMAENFPEYVVGNFVSHPKSGEATHVRGIALDLTLVDAAGHEVDMGSKFDEMSKVSCHQYKNLSESVLHNREVLKDIMTQAGFMIYPEEWWHYNLDPKKKIAAPNGKMIEAYPKIRTAPEQMLSKEVINFF